jgi:hypothetical protein
VLQRRRKGPLKARGKRQLIPTPVPNRTFNNEQMFTRALHAMYSLLVEPSFAVFSSLRSFNLKLTRQHSRAPQVELLASFKSIDPPSKGLHSLSVQRVQ